MGMGTGVQEQFLKIWSDACDYQIQEKLHFWFVSKWALPVEKKAFQYSYFTTTIYRAEIPLQTQAMSHKTWICEKECRRLKNNSSSHFRARRESLGWVPIVKGRYSIARMQKSGRKPKSHLQEGIKGRILHTVPYLSKNNSNTDWPDEVLSTGGEVFDCLTLEIGGTDPGRTLSSFQSSRIKEIHNCSSGLEQTGCQTLKDLFVYSAAKDGLILIRNIELKTWQ